MSRPGRLLCPRCGIHSPGQLCGDCRHPVAGNTSYAWQQARRETGRLFRSPCECGAGTWESCTDCRKVNAYLQNQRVAVWRAKVGQGATA